MCVVRLRADSSSSALIHLGYVSISETTRAEVWWGDPGVGMNKMQGTSDELDLLGDG